MDYLKFKTIVNKYLKNYHERKSVSLEKRGLNKVNANKNKPSQ